MLYLDLGSVVRAVERSSDSVLIVGLPWGGVGLSGNLNVGVEVIPRPIEIDRGVPRVIKTYE